MGWRRDGRKCTGEWVAGEMRVIQALVIDTFLEILYKALDLYKLPPKRLCSLYSSLANLACGIVLFKLH